MGGGNRGFGGCWRGVVDARNGVVAACCGGAVEFYTGRMEMFAGRFLRFEGVVRKKSALDGAVLDLESMELKEGASSSPLQSRAFWRENNVGPPLSLNESRTQLILSPASGKPVLLEGRIVPQFFDFDPSGEGAYYFAWFKERDEIYRKDEKDLRVWDTQTGRLKSHNRSWNSGILSPDGLSSISFAFSPQGVEALIRYDVPSGKLKAVVYRSKPEAGGSSDGASGGDCGWSPDGKFVWFTRQDSMGIHLNFNVVRVADSKLIWSAPCAGPSDWLPDGRIGLIQHDVFPGATRRAAKSATPPVRCATR